MGKTRLPDAPTPLERNHALRPRDRQKTKVEGDRTMFDIGAVTGEYKLLKEYASVRNLEFRSKEKIRLETFDEFLAERKKVARRRLRITQERRPRYPADEAYRNRRLPHLYRQGRMLVFVAKPIYAAVKAGIDRYVLDVGRDGYWATVHVVDGGVPAALRTYIRRRRPVGVLLVGNLPAPWFEMDDDFHHAHSEFPCDLYYMDGNGSWQDPDGDGKFSGHTGHLDPEIWVGRLQTPTQNGNDAALINDYFARNHKFRVGRLGHARSALAFVDDDWQGFGDCEFDTQFPSSLITTYTDPNQTDADNYKAEVNTLRSWVQLCAHSSPHSHALHVPSTSSNEYINTQYFRDVNAPNAHFYNLFCCGPGRFTSNDYLAGWYVFDKPGGGNNAGLTAIASAKSGSMLWFADFYRPLGQGKVIGDAFVRWWQARGPVHDLGERRWFYGLVLLGDPTLSWWKGAVPHLEQPDEEDVFDHWPRKMELRWDPVNLQGVKYTVEVDAFGAVKAGKWAEETGSTFYIRHNITKNKLNHTFVGAQRGRWRVRARVGSKFCSWSPWSYFRFTV